MKLPHVARLPGMFACGLAVLVWQGCGDNTREKRGGLEYIDAGPVPDAGDKSDSGSSVAKDASDDNAEHVGSGGAAGSAGASGATAGSSGGSAGRGASGSGGRGAAGKGGAASAGKGGTGGKGGAPTSAAGAGAGAAGGGAAGHAAGAGASGTTSEAGAGGASGSADEAGSGGEAGGGGPATDVVCATRGGVACGAARFCNFPPDAQCGEFDATGVCEDLPGTCDAVRAPVCGCDNVTHANACVTHRDGISVRHDGLCTREECLHAGGRPVLSDGASTPTCDEAEQVWSIESGGDESAVCCLPAHTTGRTCGGIASLECDPREFCNYETDAGGQGCDGMIADAGGVCQAIPTGCSFEYRPVCGCDKKTYSNACDAHSNGVSLLHEGACTELDCAAVAGRVVYSSGPQPMCAPGEAQWTTIVDSSGAMPIESSICCRQQ